MPFLLPLFVYQLLLPGRKGMPSTLFASSVSVLRSIFWPLLRVELLGLKRPRSIACWAMAGEFVSPLRRSAALPAVSWCRAWASPCAFRSRRAVLKGHSPKAKWLTRFMRSPRPPCLFGGQDASKVKPQPTSRASGRAFFGVDMALNHHAR